MTLKRRVVRYWIAVTLVGATLTIGAVSLMNAVGTIGDSFAGFFVGPNLLVSIGQRARWPGIQQGLKSLDRIVTVDGAEAQNGMQLVQRVREHRVGDTIDFRVERGTETRDLKIPVTRITLEDFLVGFLAPFLMGLLFVSFGAILFFAQPRVRGSLLYLTLCCVIGVFCMVIYEAYTTFTFFRITLIHPIIGALSAHLFSLFPHSRSSRPRVRIAVIGLYVMAGFLVFWRQWALGAAEESVLLSKLSSTYILLVLIVNALLLVRAWQHSVNQAERDKIKVLIIGLAMATSVIAAWSLNFLLVTKSFYLDEGMLIATIFPLFMGYAILRRNIFGLDRVIRLSLSYGLTAALFFVVYLAIFGAVREQLSEVSRTRYLGILLVVLAGAGAWIFNLVRRRVNRLVQRALFRNQYNLSEALEELDRSLVSGLTAREWVDRVGNRLSQVLDVERALLICPAIGPGGQIWVQRFRWPSGPEAEKWWDLMESEGFLSLFAHRGTPIELSDLARETPDRFRQSMATLTAHALEVAIPFVSGGNLYGMLFLGRKLSGERYDETEMPLLAPLVGRTGLGLENAKLLAEKDQQSRLAALGQVASIMVHDVKNPLSTIKIAAGSIKKRFREGDHSHELATIIEEEVNRMNHTIQEILQFVKPVGVSVSSFRLNDLVRDLTELVRPLFQQSGASIECELTEEDTLLEGDRSRIHRALENLIMNAKEALSPGGTVRIRTSVSGVSNGHARVSLTVEDNGQGMENSVRDHVFQAFYTTKPHGTGLGLAIVKQVVDEHRGEIELETKPGAGTRFTLHFPVRSKVE